MDRIESTNTEPYVPPLQLTEGQPAPIAANGGLSYLSFAENGDAGTGEALKDALALAADDEGPNLVARIENAPPGPIETKWGPGFRTYEDCLAYINEQGIAAPEGGIVAPLGYTVYERPTYSVVPSNSLWRNAAPPVDMGLIRRQQENNQKYNLYFPVVLRDARRIGEYYPGLRPDSAECMDRLGLSVAHLESKLENIYDAAEVERVFYPEIEKLLLDFFPGATDALVYNHDCFDADYTGDRTENQDAKNPGVQSSYSNRVHNDLNDNSGRLRCWELLTQNLRNFGRQQTYTEAEAREKMSRRFMSINLAKPAEPVGQYPFVLCAWPSFAKQPYINNYRIYDDRVGETTRFTWYPDHEWYWFPQQKPTEVSMLKCYDSVSDGSVSRWSFHTACKDPTAPADARNRRNVVVRSYVFF